MLSLRFRWQKLIAWLVLCFSHSKVLKLDLINPWKASNVSKLDSSLNPQSSWEWRIEDRLSSIELRGTVNLHLSGTVLYNRQIPICQNSYLALRLWRTKQKEWFIPHSWHDLFCFVPLSLETKLEFNTSELDYYVVLFSPSRWHIVHAGLSPFCFVVEQTETEICCWNARRSIPTN